MLAVLLFALLVFWGAVAGGLALLTSPDRAPVPSTSISISASFELKSEKKDA